MIEKKTDYFYSKYFSAGLLATSITLDFRVTALEENEGSDGNSSVAELEVRVEAFEGTAADHETRISNTESDVSGGLHLRIYVMLFLMFQKPNSLYLNISDLEEVTSDQETRLTAAEENIKGKN